MSVNDGSVSILIEGVKSGDSEAIRRLLDRCWDRLVTIARRRVAEAPRPGADLDEEDFALSAFKSLCIGAAAGRFEEVGGSKDLWKMLAVIAANKIIDWRRREGRHKRGGGRILDESALAGGDADNPLTLEEITATSDDPVFEETLVAECRRLVASLGDGFRQVAELRLEGHSVDEIAAKLGCSRAKINRRLNDIRTLLKDRLK